jgi:hypothetical protein
MAEILKRCRTIILKITQQHVIKRGGKAFRILSPRRLEQRVEKDEIFDAGFGRYSEKQSIGTKMVQHHIGKPVDFFEFRRRGSLYALMDPPPFDEFFLGGHSADLLGKIF